MGRRGLREHIFKLLFMSGFHPEEELADQVDVIFTATPQGLCASLVNEGILSKV